MVIPTARDIVVVPFPFTDLSSNKIRPAVVLADIGRGGWVLYQITSNAYADTNATELTATDFVSGGLKVTSYARPGKLFTANEKLFKGKEGKLKPQKLAEVKGAVIKLLK